MAAQIDYNKCKMCGGNVQPLCVEICPDSAVRVQDGRPVVTEFSVRTATSAAASARTAPSACLWKK